MNDNSVVVYFDHFAKCKKVTNLQWVTIVFFMGYLALDLHWNRSRTIYRFYNMPLCLGKIFCILKQDSHGYLIIFLHSSLYYQLCHLARFFTKKWNILYRIILLRCVVKDSILRKRFLLQQFPQVIVKVLWYKGSIANF